MSANAGGTATDAIRPTVRSSAMRYGQAGNLETGEVGGGGCGGHGCGVCLHLWNTLEKLQLVLTRYRVYASPPHMPRSIHYPPDQRVSPN